MDMTISLQALFWICGGLAALWGIFKIIKNPFDKLDDHERRLKTLEEDRQERRQTDKVILTTLSAMVNHMIDGNNVQEMKKVRDDLQKSIIDSHK